MIFVKAELLTLSLPIERPLRMSFGIFHEKVILLVKLFTKDGLVGYGECPTFQLPTYLPEFTGSEREVLKCFILPRILGKEFHHPEELQAALAFIRGHGFAKAAVECAFWHLIALEENKSLQELFGGVQKHIEVGATVGIQESIDEALDEIESSLHKGFKRIKLKIKRGWDYDVTAAIRKRYPKISLMLDGNSDYTLKDLKFLKRFDEFRLLMLEQPLGYDDLVDHSMLQEELSTPICLDESISNAEDTRKALYLRSCKTINIRPLIVGGPLESIKIHDYCMKQNVPVWCGSILETGIGWAFNLALASLPNFKYPADITETLLYFKEDLVDNPSHIHQGKLEVPTEPGLGFRINDKTIEKYTVQKMMLSAGG